MRTTTHRTRRTVTLGLAAAALGTALTLGNSGTAMAAPIPPSGPSQSTSNSATVTGDQQHLQALPNDMQTGFDLWFHMGWPNWRNIGTRQWFLAGSFADSRTHQQIQENIFTGGQYNDRDGALRDFMNAGGAGTSGPGYTGTFQEYNTTVYTTQGTSAVPNRDARRIVRALSTGDVWWTSDHYSSFHYMGRF
ncbi:ribonuclease domain-containing protein [Streptomyces sp. NPDC004539]|uniref:ribonuclease domain-containing protein n=1 Tax=Streptomyces sp. NPDC004539 TaxID=3154280 RepID=UPI0033A53515